MAVRYVFGFTDVEGSSFEGSFSNPAYTGAFIDIRGTAQLDKDARGNIAQPIQAKTCSVSLEASLEQPLEDIYNENDRYWLFQLKQNNKVIFQGYASTEGMEQPFGSHKWDLSFNCFGHLANLEEFGYYNENGSAYTGRASLLVIILNCLAKGFERPSERMNVLAAHHLTLGNKNVFENVYLDQSQFYDDDGEADDCKKVLEDVLKSIGCFIVQRNKEWYITSVKLWVNFIKSPITYDFFSSDYTGPTPSVPGNGLGIQLGSPLLVLTNKEDMYRIGDHINGVPTHHVNQPVFYSNRLYNTVRARHKFQYAAQMLANGELVANGGTMPSWSIISGLATVSGDAIEVQGVQLDANTAVALESSPVALKVGDALDLAIAAEYVTNPTQVYYQLILTNTPSGEEYSYQVYQSGEDSENFQSGGWVKLPVGSLVRYRIRLSPAVGVYQHKLQISELPEDGDVIFKVFTGVFGNAFNATSKIILNSVALKASAKPVEAEEYTVTRTDTKSGRVPDVYSVRFNTSDRNILKNIFVGADGVAVPYFQEKGVDVVMMEDLARMLLMLFSQNYYVWVGDVFNNHPFSTKKIDGVGSNFLVTNESIDLEANVSSLVMQSVALDMPPYVDENRRVYKNPVKPTLKVT